MFLKNFSGSQKSAELFKLDDKVQLGSDDLSRIERDHSDPQRCLTANMAKFYSQWNTRFSNRYERSRSEHIERQFKNNLLNKLE